MTSKNNDNKTPHATLPSRTTSIPLPHEVDDAPHLVVVALAQTTLLAVRRALDSAHPILAAATRPAFPPHLTSDEHLAALILHASSELESLLFDYELAVLSQLYDEDEELEFPF